MEYTCIGNFCGKLAQSAFSEQRKNQSSIISHLWKPLKTCQTKYKTRTTQNNWVSPLYSFHLGIKFSFDNI